ncbi:MAG: aminotransferase class III-fold pyridoxal phosphate-dependent enzyme, partial [Fimbriimonadaceae bacterium]
SRVVQEVRIVEEEGLIERARIVGDRLAEGLRKLVDRYRPVVHNVRGLGLYQGFSLDTPELRSAVIETALQEHSLLLLGAGNRSIRTRPNLSVTEEEVDLFLDLLGKTLAKVVGSA